MKEKIILITGHSVNKSGAISKDGKLNEYHLNESILKEVKNIYEENKDTSKYELDFVFYNTFPEAKTLTSFYSYISLFEGVKFALEFHNNSSIHTVSGCEILIEKNPVKEKGNMAEDILSKICILLGLKNRGLKYISLEKIGNNYKERGAAFLDLVGFPAMLFEIGFINNDSDLKSILDNKEKLAKLLYDEIQKW